MRETKDLCRCHCYKPLRAPLRWVEHSSTLPRGDWLPGQISSCLLLCPEANKASVAIQGINEGIGEQRATTAYLTSAYLCIRRNAALLLIWARALNSRIYEDGDGKGVRTPDASWQAEVILPIGSGRHIAGGLEHFLAVLLRWHASQDHGGA